MLCASVTQFFIYGACYITNRLIIVPMFGFSTIGIFLLLFYNLLLFMASLSHYRTMTTDPGAVPRKAEPLPRDSNKFKRIGRPLPKCRRTGVYKPPRAHFDRQIQRNVVRMDHHCPWVNNCVGLGNQKLFLLFLLYISLSCWLSLGLVLTLFVRCGQSSSRMALKIMAKSGMPRAPRHTELATQEMLEVCKLTTQSPHVTILYALLTFEALMFGLFTICMLCDQVGSIVSDQTKIDRLQKKTFRKANPFFQNLAEVMGDAEYCSEWLWPSKPCWRDWETLYGYTLPGEEREKEIQKKNEIEKEEGSDVSIKANIVNFEDKKVQSNSAIELGKLGDEHDV